MNINVIELSSTYKLEDNEFTCSHEHTETEKACCPSGTVDCACQGRDAVYCLAFDCSGIQEYEIERLFEDVV